LDVLIQEQLQEQVVVTETDQLRLRAMIESLRRALRTVGDPYESYLRALEEKLDRTSAVPRDVVNADTVTMNSRVLVRDPDSGTGQVLTLVYEAEADPFGQHVSVLTTLGASLLGSTVGDIIEWQTRRGPRRLRIERILFQPEAAGVFDL
jgi:regulator of nucleoside diphosphate kinase